MSGILGLLLIFHERCICRFFVLLALLVPSEIQASEVSFEGLEILEIQHQSLSIRPVVTEQDFVELFDLRVGDLYSSKRARHAVGLLYRSRPLKDVMVDIELYKLDGHVGNGVILKVLTVPKSRVVEILLEGNNGISTDHLRGEIGIEIGSLLSEHLEGRIVEVLKETYRFFGYFQSTFATELRWKERGTEASLRITIDEGPRATVRDIQFHGSLVLALSTLNDTISAGIGDPYDEDVVRQDVRDLRALYHSEGYFDVTVGLPDIQYDKQLQAVSIRIWIHAGTRLQVIFDGNYAFSDAVLNEQLDFGSKRVIDQDALEASREVLMSFYRNSGYPFVNVRVHHEVVESLGVTKVSMVIDEGVPVSIGEVKITGNSFILTSVLQDLIGTYDTRWFSEPLLREGQLENDRRAIEVFYRERGFPAVRVKHTVRYREDLIPAEANIHFRIEEGVQLILVDVEITGNVTMPKNKLLEVLSMRPGMPVTPVVIEEGRAQLLRIYQERGYRFSEIAANVVKKYSNRGVVINYSIKEGRPVTVGKIKFEGNDTTLDFILARELSIRSGDRLNPYALARSRDQIKNLDYIDDVEIKINRPNTLESTKDLTVNVDEQFGGTIEFGVGFGDVEGARGFVDVSHSNLFGTGRTIGARAEISQIEQRYALRYREPWFLGQPLDAVATVSYLTEERVATDLLSFDRLTIYEYKQPFGTAFGFESRLTENMTATILYRYEIDDIFKVRDEIIAARRLAGLPDDRQKITIASLMPSIIWDMRNDPFNPTEGSFHALSLKQSAKMLGSEDQFYKFTGQTAWFAPIGKRVVLALQGRAGYTERFGDTSRVAIVERFFAGGRNTVRGYDQDTLGVTGQTVVDGIPTGGNAMFVSNAEFRVALPRAVGLVVFLDGGNVWRDARNIDFHDMKFSVGPGIRYNTPVGPLRLDFGYKLRREAGESPAQLHFTLGHAF